MVREAQPRRRGEETPSLFRGEREGVGPRSAPLLEDVMLGFVFGARVDEHEGMSPALDRAEVDGELRSFALQSLRADDGGIGVVAVAPACSVDRTVIESGTARPAPDRSVPFRIRFTGVQGAFRSNTCGASPAMRSFTSKRWLDCQETVTAPPWPEDATTRRFPALSTQTTAPACVVAPPLVARTMALRAPSGDPIRLRSVRAGASSVHEASPSGAR